MRTPLNTKYSNFDNLFYYTCIHHLPFNITVQSCNYNSSYQQTYHFRKYAAHEHTEQYKVQHPKCRQKTHKQLG